MLSQLGLHGRVGSKLANGRCGVQCRCRVGSEEVLRWYNIEQKAVHFVAECIFPSGPTTGPQKYVEQWSFRLFLDILLHGWLSKIWSPFGSPQY